MDHLRNLSGSPLVRVKLVTVVHLILIINALMSSWAPPAYLFYNLLFIVSLFWSIHARDSIDAALMAAAIDLLSCIFDFIIIIGYFSKYSGWSGTFAIINFLVRPFSVIILHREFNDRGGLVMSGSVFPTNQQRSYEDIDRTPNQSLPT